MRNYYWLLALVLFSACDSVEDSVDVTGRWVGEEGWVKADVRLTQAGEQVSGDADVINHFWQGTWTGGGYTLQVSPEGESYSGTWSKGSEQGTVSMHGGSLTWMRLLLHFPSHGDPYALLALLVGPVYVDGSTWTATVEEGLDKGQVISFVHSGSRSPNHYNLVGAVVDNDIQFDSGFVRGCTLVSRTTLDCRISAVTVDEITVRLTRQ